MSNVERPVQIINLERAVDRRERMAASLAARGVPFEFFRAMSGTSAPERLRRRHDSTERIRRFGYDLSDGEIGCFLSHIACVERPMEAGWKRVVIMEDDVEVDDDFAETIARVGELDDRFEFVRLCGLRRRATRFRFPPTAGRRLERLLGPARGTQCYALSRRGMERFLRLGDPLVTRVDIALDRCWEHGMETFAVQPYPVRPADVPSQIEGARDNAPWRRDRRWGLRARLKVGKWRDRVWREIHNLRTWFADRAEDRRIP